jgi:hypothetical protein
MGFATSLIPALQGWSHYNYGTWSNQQDTLTVTGQFLPAGSTTATTTPLSILKNSSLAGEPAVYTGQRGYNFQVIHDATNTGQYDVLFDRDPQDILNIDWDLTLSALPGSAPSVITQVGTSWIPHANANRLAGTNQQFHFACVYLVGVTPTDVPNNVLNTLAFTAILKISSAAP